MRKKSYLKLCNNPFKEKADKVEKRAIILSIIAGGIVAIIVLIIVLASIS